MSAGAPMGLKRIPYPRVGPLIRDYLPEEESEDTATVIERLRPARRRGYFTRAELEIVCRWKSARAIHLVRKNSAARVRRVTRRALSTRSERRRLAALTSLHGVSVPMASAALTLLQPRRYGVIDIRVWQLLHTLGAVTRKPRGVGFDFDSWYQFLTILRHFARTYGVSARDVERALFQAHTEYQRGLLYSGRTEGSRNDA